ncbi:MAG TPA: hypothetical protein VGH93_09460 [Solirubrobacteraceae bacterium]
MPALVHQHVLGRLRELQLDLSEGAKDLLVDKGWDPSMGARPLRRAIQRYIEDPLADFVLREQVPSGSTVMVETHTEQGDGAEPSDGAERSEEDDVKLTVIAPKPKPTPVGVGAEGGSEGDSPPEEPKVPDSPPDGE